MIVLHYLNAPANTWQVFVANRVSKIQSMSNVENWYHIDGKLNPADIISRGAYPKSMNNKLYWNGPDFLCRPISCWPKNSFRPTIEINTLPEKRKVVLATTVEPEFSLLTKFSSFSKLQRVMAFCLRFIHNLKNKTKGQREFLSTQELQEAHNALIRIVQKRDFSREISALEKHQPVSKNSKLYSLDCFIDDQGLIRVGGRLRNSTLCFDRKFPILLPAKHYVTQLLIRKEHITLLHAGATQTLASIRTRYWPLQARSSVRKIIHSCITCFRMYPRLSEQKMGDLPKERITPCRPFSKVGLDYFGPIYIKQSGKRSTKTIKAWVALFVCLVTKAVHLEVVGDLTSECFINALKRFIARRGMVLSISCDNGRTFVGAKRELDDISKFLLDENFHSELQPFLSNANISWKFIPPRAPNFGGLWERLVRSTKHHLKRVVMNANLTFEEAITLMSQIEAVINSRPLTPISNDPSDFQVLTPAHFLIGETFTSLPERDLCNTPETRLSRWQRIQKLKQHFWKRWSLEVLSQFQAKQKWRQRSPDLCIGSMVLIADDNAPPMLWKLGRIERVSPGPDGIVRVATVRTSQGVYTRSIRKLAVLPIDEKQCSD